MRILTILTNITKQCFWGAPLALLFLLGAYGCAPDHAIEYEKLRQQGEQLYSQNKYNDAIAVWRRALQHRPNSPTLHTRLGDAYLRIADLPLAENVYSQVVKNAPESWPIWLKIARIRLAYLDFPQVEKILSRLEEHWLTVPVFILKGDMHTIRNNFSEAEKAYQAALLRQPAAPDILVKLASCFLGQQKHDEAAALYAQINIAAIQEPETLIHIANYWKLQGDVVIAGQYLEQAVAMVPEDMVLLKNLAEFHLVSGQLESATLAVNQILDISPNSRFAKKILIEIYLSENRLEETQELLEQISDEDDLELLILKGKYHLMNHDPLGAISNFIAFTEKEPNLPYVHYLLGLSFMASGQINLARQSLIYSLSLDNSFNDAELALADLYYKMGEYQLAQEHAQRVSLKEPQNIRPYLILGAINIALTKYQEARKQFRKAALFAPDIIQPTYFEGVIAALQGKGAGAEEIYREILSEYPNLIDVAGRYAMLMKERGKATEGADTIKELASQSTMNAVYLHLLGELYHARGDHSAATDSYTRAMELAPSQLASYFALAKIQKEANEWQQVIATFTLCIRNNPQYAPAYTELAMAYNQAGRTDRALSTLEDAVRQFPQEYGLANNLAWLYLEQGKKINEAFILAQKAYEQLPGVAAAADTLGWAYYNKNIMTRALWLIEEAYTLSPDHPLINYHLAMVLLQHGKEDKAAEHGHKALQHGLGEPYKTKTHDLLRSMGAPLPGGRQP